MHFTTTVEALTNAWTYLQKIPVRPFTPEGTLVRAEGDVLTVTMTDTDMTMRIQIPGVTIIEEGVLSFSLKSVMGSFKSCQKTSEVNFWTTPVENEPNAQMLHVHVEDYDVALLGQTESLTRMMDEMEEETLHSIVLSQNYLKQGLENSAFAAVTSANRAMRAIFQSVLIELAPNEIRFIATDTNNFAYFKRTNIDNQETLAICLPIKATEILTGILREMSDSEVRFSFGERFFSVATEDFTFIARLREGKFPDYHFAIPKGELHEVAVSRSEIKSALEFFASYALSKDLPIEMIVQGEKMELSLAKSRTVALAKKPISCVSEGDKVYKLAFQMSALKNAFDHFSSQDVYLCIPDDEGIGSAILRPASEIDENVEFWQLITTTDIAPLPEV